MKVHAGLFTHAGPSGPLNARDHQAFRAEFLADLERAMPVDAVFLFMHGAQIAQGCDDVEGDLLAAIRSRVGSAVPIAVLLDLHANISAQMLATATFTIGCLEYPHTDYAERAGHAVELVQAVLQGASLPVTLAWRMPVVGLYRTTEGPMQKFVAGARAIQATRGVLSVSAFHGFFLGDTPDTGATLVMSVEASAVSEAKPLGAQLAAKFIAAARAVSIAPGLDEALADALGPSPAGRPGPVVFADSGDNPGGGAAGDSTFVLEALLARDVRDVAFGMLWDPVAVDFAHRAGVGSTMALRIGGKVSALSGRPLDVVAEVLTVRDDARQALFAQGEPKASLGRSAALRVGGVDIVLNSERQQVFDPRCFSEHGIDISTKRLVVVKGSTHFANGFAPLASRIVYCSSPGSVSLDPTLFDFRNLRRPLYPLDRSFEPRAVPVAR